MLISVLVSTLLTSPAQPQGTASAITWTDKLSPVYHVKCVRRVAQRDGSPRASRTFVRHTNILFPSNYRQVRSKFSVHALTAGSEMTNQMSALFTEREKRAKNHKSLPR